MNVALKRHNCLSNIPQRDGKVAHPKPSVGVPHIERVTQAATIACIRYKKTIEELAKV